MPRFRFLVGLLPLLLASASSGEAKPGSDAKARQIVEAAFANLYQFSSVQQIEIRSTLRDGREFVRSAQMVRGIGPEGRNRMLARFTGPPDLRRIGMLLTEREDFSYDAFIYQPQIKRVRRISLAQRGDAFFGTDVYYEDLESKRSSQWTSRLDGEAFVADRVAWRIELHPREFPSGYERIVAWFDQQMPIILRAEFYRNGRLLKTLEVEPVRVVEVEGLFVPTLMLFSSARESETTVEVTSIEVRESLPAERFTTSALEFGSVEIDSR